MSENNFLWQMIYRMPATNKWRFPARPSSDPDTWCVRCQQQCPKDLLHCMWACPNANRCWMWCAELLAWLSVTPQGGLQLNPAHILIAEALPHEWDTPVRLWHTIRAIMSWIIWKDRNQHVFGGERSNVTRMIRLTWHRLSMYMRIAWKDLLSKVRLDRLTLTEAQDLMAIHFGAMGKLWTLSEVRLQIPPVPPRPP